jgi:N-acetylglutamate synthase-like GNAT family acetyltransferase
MGPRPAIRRLRADDLPAITEMATTSWGSTRVVSRGRRLDILDLPGFVAEVEDVLVAYLSFEVIGGACEVVVLHSQHPGAGSGTALLVRLVARCVELGLARIWVITTNDNTPALRWYQRRGFQLVALHRDAVTESRRLLKPEIPLRGVDDIEIRDEIELELPRARWERLVAAVEGAAPGDPS